jgi:hypothetical protein
VKVFLTWSGPVSHAVAKALREWIPLVLQRVNPFLSSEDIRKGSRWQSEIAAELASVSYAIICLTPDNLDAPWIHFEAGAVSKNLETGRVTALLIGIAAADVKLPLSQFQHTIVDREDVRKLVRELNASFGEVALGAEQLDTTFEMFWPKLAEQINAARRLSIKTELSVSRSTEDLLGEILELNRENVRTSAAMKETLAAQAVAIRRLQRAQSPLTEEQIGGLHGFTNIADMIVPSSTRGALSSLVSAPGDGIPHSARSAHETLERLEALRRKQKRDETEPKD